MVTWFRQIRMTRHVICRALHGRRLRRRGKRVHGSDAAANAQHHGDDGDTDGYLLTVLHVDSISSLGVALDGHHITVPIGC
jgi:hypothetical protein